MTERMKDTHSGFLVLEIVTNLEGKNIPYFPNVLKCISEAISINIKAWISLYPTQEAA